MVEDFTVSPSLVITDAALDEATSSCDDDGVLDAGEAGHLVLTVRNGGAAPLTGATLTATTTTPGATVTTTAVDVPDVAPFAETTVSFDVPLDDTTAPHAILDVEVAIDAPGSCTATATFSFQRASNLDVVPMSSATDDVEADLPAWTATGGGGDSGLGPHDSTGPPATCGTATTSAARPTPRSSRPTSRSARPTRWS